MSSSRRAFVVTCGMAAAGGCLARGSTRPAYQIVGGVEWKHLRGTRANTVTKIAQNKPVAGPVVHDAPIDMELQTVSFDDAIVDLSGEGSLTLDRATIDRIEAEYDDPYGVVVLTLYNEDPHNDIPQGNSYGYRVGLEQLNRVDPGDRISATIEQDSELVIIDEIRSVDTA